MNADFPIDFVIPWVDGSDPAWIKVCRKVYAMGKQSSFYYLRAET